MKLNSNIHTTIDGLLGHILSTYVSSRTGEVFSRKNEIRKVFKRLKEAFISTDVVSQNKSLTIRWSVGAGRWAHVPWVAFLDTRITRSTQKGVYVAFLFRQDMSGVYLTLTQGITEPKRNWGGAEGLTQIRSRAEKLRGLCASLSSRDFTLDNQIDLRTDVARGKGYEAATAAYKLYDANNIPSSASVLEDLEEILMVYRDYVESEHGTEPSEPEKLEIREPIVEPATFNLAPAVDGLVADIANAGFVYEPWQISAYVTALRTKPFVILAGVSGTGKSKLPKLVAEATGGEAILIPVRPDWTDSSDVLGYLDIQGEFRPGALLEIAHKATKEPSKMFVCIIDEMNIARVEYYFAEVLSRVEDRRPAKNGGFRSCDPLLTLGLPNQKSHWDTQYFPPNLAIVGTVNMDETTHGFSRKVLDRAFTIELSDIDLTVWEPYETGMRQNADWPTESWFPTAIQLGNTELDQVERKRVKGIIEELNKINSFLVSSQLQLGYRTRDEIVLFILHAAGITSSFKTRKGVEVDPLDLAIHMKVLPRIVGGSNAVRRSLMQLLGWSQGRTPFSTDDEVDAVLNQWERSGRPQMMLDAVYPRTTARLCLMWDRLLDDGFTSFWM